MKTIELTRTEQTDTFKSSDEQHTLFVRQGRPSILQHKVNITLPGGEQVQGYVSAELYLPHRISAVLQDMPEGQKVTISAASAALEQP